MIQKFNKFIAEYTIVKVKLRDSIALVTCFTLMYPEKESENRFIQICAFTFSYKSQKGLVNEENS